LKTSDSREVIICGQCAGHVLQSNSPVLAPESSLINSNVANRTSAARRSYTGDLAVDETTSGKSASRPDDVFLEKVRKLASVNWRVRDEALRAFVDEAHLVAGSKFPVDEAEVRAWAPLEYDRQRDILSFRYNTPIAETNTPAWRSNLPHITAPTLVIHGTEDPVLPFANAVAMAKEIPGAKLISIEGMGHELPRGAWPVIVPAIREHTAQC
jgi:pimeloyl-ACP methyl ester carboxylesterase